MSNASVHERRHPAKPKRAHLQDRRDWWKGYEDAWLGRTARSVEPWYLHGHREGQQALLRRDAIRTDKNRTESRRDAAPELMALMDRKTNSNRMAGL